MNDATLTIARALLARGIAVTPELVTEFMASLSQLPGWGEQEAAAAAVLKSLGLPVSPGTLSLAGEPALSLTVLLDTLRSQLKP
jgi:hypothetical protein